MQKDNKITDGRNYAIKLFPARGRKLSLTNVLYTSL